tara:strand:- start:481 stop:1326 length:846 start_codon:yes stop_codon:yes gene_type:complete
MVYCAYTDAPTWAAQRAPNVELFNATLDFVESTCPHLKHITLLQGTKAYGSHLGPFKTPAKETDDRIANGFFYYDQHDSLIKRSEIQGWNWTVVRPHVVIGPAFRSPLNLIAVLGVYASLIKAMNQPLAFPGPKEAFGAIYQATDSNLLSNAINWAGENENAKNQIFNVTNGDFFRWSNLWSRIASVFQLETTDPKPQSLVETMSHAAPLWKRLSQKHGLVIEDLSDLVSWNFADYVFGTTWDVMSDTLKIRKAGFMEFIDSEEIILKRLKELKHMKILPP